MAFREKMLWLSLAVTLGIWGWYFMRFVAMWKSGNFDQGAATGVGSLRRAAVLA